MTKTLRPDTIQSSRPIIPVRLEGTNKLLVLVHAQGIAEPLVITQHLVNGLYLPHYRAEDPRTCSIVRQLASRVTIHISHQHNILSATVDLPKGSKGLRSGYAQCISMADALNALQDRMPLGSSEDGRRLPMIKDDYPDAGYAMRVIEYLQQQLQPKDEVTKAVQMTLPVQASTAHRLLTRERVEQLHHALNADDMAIRNLEARVKDLEVQLDSARGGLEMAHKSRDEKIQELLTGRA